MSSKPKISSQQSTLATAKNVVDPHLLTPTEFESLTARLLRKMGFEAEETRPTGDGGVDVIARHPGPITGGLYVIQCKRYAGNVGEPIIRDLYGTVHHLGATKGVIVTTGGFTTQAYQFAEGKPLELISGDQLQRLCLQYSLDGASPDQRCGQVELQTRLKVPRWVKYVQKRISKSVSRVHRVLHGDFMNVPKTKRSPPLSELDLLDKYNTGPYYLTVGAVVARLISSSERILEQEDASSGAECDANVEMFGDCVSDLIRTLTDLSTMSVLLSRHAFTGAETEMSRGVDHHKRLLVDYVRLNLQAVIDWNGSLAAAPARSGELVAQSYRISLAPKFVPIENAVDLVATYVALKAAEAKESEQEAATRAAEEAKEEQRKLTTGANGCAVLLCVSVATLLILTFLLSAR